MIEKVDLGLDERTWLGTVRLLFNLVQATLIPSGAVITPSSE
jgi:hypothetical protein